MRSDNFGILLGYGGGINNGIHTFYILRLMLVIDLDAYAFKVVCYLARIDIRTAYDETSVI